MIRLGRYYNLKPGENARDLDSSLYFLRSAASLAQQANLPDIRRTCHYYLAQAYIECRAPEETKAMLPLINEFEQMVIRYYLSWYYLRKDGRYNYDLDTALLFGNRALQDAKTMQRSDYIGYISVTLAEAHLERGRPQEALLVADAAPANVQPKIWYLAGEHYRTRPGQRRTDLDTAFMLGLKSFTAADRQRDSAVLSLCGYQLTVIEERLGKVKPGTQFIPYMRGHDLGYIAQRTAYASLRQNEHPDSCERYLKVALQGFRTDRMDNLVRQVENGLKGVYIVRTTEAAVSGLSPDRQFNMWMDTANKYTNAGRQMDQDISNAAIYCVDRAAAIAESLNSNAFRAKAWMRMGYIYSHRHEPDSAWRYYQFAIDKYMRGAQWGAVAQLYFFMAYNFPNSRDHLAIKAKAYNLARQYYHAAGKLWDALEAGIAGATNLLEDSQVDACAALLDTLTIRYPAMENKDAYKLHQLKALLAQQKANTRRHYSIRYGGCARPKRKRLIADQDHRHPACRDICRSGRLRKSMETYKWSIDLHRDSGFHYMIVPPFTMRGYSPFISRPAKPWHSWTRPAKYTRTMIFIPGFC